MTVLDKDLESLLTKGLPINEYENKTFLITGSTGMIGSLLVKSLLYLNDKMNLHLKVIAGIRNERKANSIFRDYRENPSLEFAIVDFGSGQINIDYQIDFIIHAAAVTQSKYMISNPVETIKISVNGTEEILDFAKNNNVSSIVYISSMEIYGQLDIEDKIAENQLGFIDLKSSRSCYPESKRLCEMLCTAYSSEYGLDVKSARLAQTFGAGILPGENRVFAQFARSVIHKNDIVLHTDGLSEGNYVYTFDAIAALLLLLTKGVKGETYNVSNINNHSTIIDMAKMVAHKIANDEINVVIDLPDTNMGYAPKTKIWLDNSKMLSLGWVPTVNLEESYRRMIQWMIESNTGE